MYESVDTARPLPAQGSNCSEQAQMKGPTGVDVGYAGPSCDYGGQQASSAQSGADKNMLQLLTDVNKASGNQPLHLDRNDISVVVDESFCIKSGGNGGPRWQCNVCPKYYATKNNLVTHLLGHYGLKAFVCTICKKSFNQATRLKFHMLSHKGNKRTHICSICKRPFAQLMHLRRHVLSHENRQPYTCKACAKGFALLGELQSHLELHKQPNVANTFAAQMFVKEEQDEDAEQGTASTNLRCKLCDRKFLFPSQMKDHMLSHTQIRRFICQICNQKFLKVHHLKAHNLIHSQIRPHKCSICARAFTLKGNLIRHLLTHSKEKNFECNACGRKFSQRQTLKTHMVIHLNSKPFSCPICGKALARSHNLKSHMSLHQSIKPYKCPLPLCNSAFTMKGNLHRHYKEKHKDAIKTTLNLDTQKTGTAVVLSSQYFTPNVRGPRIDGGGGGDLKLDGLFNFSSFSQSDLADVTPPTKKGKKSSAKKRKADKQRHLQQQQEQGAQDGQGAHQSSQSMNNVLGCMGFGQGKGGGGASGPPHHGPGNATCGLAFHNSLLTYCNDSSCACKFQGQLGYNHHIIHKLNSLHSAIDTLAAVGQGEQHSDKVSALHLAIDEVANLSQQRQQQIQQQQPPPHTNNYC